MKKLITATIVTLVTLSSIISADCMDEITPIDAFDHFSGYTGKSYEGISFTNYPTIWASKTGGEKLTVSGVGYRKEFAMKDFDKAIKAYKALLILNEYNPPR
ncbi:hypothetical protein N9X61_01170 [Sulfurimonas sp.]|nr:hypothetical protein [Sulfurimonas sp.]